MNNLISINIGLSISLLLATGYIIRLVWQIYKLNNEIRDYVREDSKKLEEQLEASIIEAESEAREAISGIIERPSERG